MTLEQMMDDMIKHNEQAIKGLRILKSLDLYKPIHQHIKHEDDYLALILAAGQLAHGAPVRFRAIAKALLDVAIEHTNSPMLTFMVNDPRLQHIYGKDNPPSPAENDYHIHRCMFLDFPDDSVQYFNTLFTMDEVDLWQLAPNTLESAIWALNSLIHQHESWRNNQHKFPHLPEIGYGHDRKNVN